MAACSCAALKSCVSSGLSILAPSVRQTYSRAEMLMRRLRAETIFLSGRTAFRSSLMPTNPADGPILGTLYGSDAMRTVFDERAYFQRMLDVEAALAQVQGRLGIIPGAAVQAIGEAAAEG